MRGQELADLPFAAALTPHQGSLVAGGDYDTVHFDRLSFTDADASGSRFLECALTHASFPAGQLRRARFTGRGCVTCAG
jgi:uncharacterized protein YjbI with pentapeptide repeats